MKNKSFVFDKTFDNYFLFLDNEIVPNSDFYERIKSFSKKNHGNELIVDLVNLRGNEAYKNKSVYKIKNSSPYSLDILSQVLIQEDKTYEDLLFEFLIYDDTGEWAIYCHVGKDYGIGGCSNLVYNSFLNEINPYKDISFENKLNEIGMSFADEKKKKEFYQDLLSNYKFE